MSTTARADFGNNPMGLREDALRRILSLDSTRSAQLALRLAQEQVQARSGAVLAIDADGYRLFATNELGPRDLARISSAWEQMRESLLDGQALTCRDWTLLPIGKPATCIVYMGEPGIPISGVLVRQLRDELGQLFGLAVSVRTSEPELRALREIALEQLPLQRLVREKLLLVLRSCNWNKTRAAEVLHVTRPTLYKWIERHGIKEPA